MKNRAYQFSKLKKKLMAKKQAGVPYVEWRLNKEQVEAIKRWGCVPEEWLHTVETRKFNNIHNVSSHLLKDLHYSKKRGKKTITCHLSYENQELLRSLKIRYWPTKYRIYLRGQNFN